jgi:hypothetical protein
LEVCELRKLKEKWVDNSIALPELPSKRWKDAQGASSSSSGMKILHVFLFLQRYSFFFSNVALSILNSIQVRG